MGLEDCKISTGVLSCTWKAVSCGFGASPLSACFMTLAGQSEEKKDRSGGSGAHLRHSWSAARAEVEWEVHVCGADHPQHVLPRATFGSATCMGADAQGKRNARYGGRLLRPIARGASHAKRHGACANERRTAARAATPGRYTRLIGHSQPRMHKMDVFASMPSRNVSLSFRAAPPGWTSRRRGGIRMIPKPPLTHP